MAAPVLTIARLDDATIEAAGALVAGEHVEARRVHPGLPPAFATPRRAPPRCDGCWTAATPASSP